MLSFARYPSLLDRTVLITGGATGIGASLVEEFARQGAKVGFVDIDRDAGDALCVALRDQVATTPLFVAADLTDLHALRQAIGEVQVRLGPIAVLVNNAADDRRHTIEETTPDSWEHGLAVNLRHQFFAAQQACVDMKRANAGSIINLGSVTWMLNQGGMPVYLASKAAIQGLTGGLARDLGKFNIRVNTLVPGWVMTPKQLKPWVTDAAREEIAHGQCLGGPLLGEHIARMALFLASDDSAMCTAQDFVVDGGWV